MTFFYFIKLVITHVACHTVKWAATQALTWSKLTFCKRR